MHFGDTIFIFLLALVVFGPKKLPEIGRQIGKLMVEFRRASNDFKLQIEEELRASEQADRQKALEAQAAIPVSSTSETQPSIMPPSEGAAVSQSAEYASNYNNEPVAPYADSFSASQTDAAVPTDGTAAAAEAAEVAETTDAADLLAKASAVAASADPVAEVAQIAPETPSPNAERYFVSGNEVPGSSASTHDEAPIHHG